MAFLDKLSDIGKSVAQKSGEIAESSKITMNIKKKERDIRGVKLEIGKYIYQQYKNGVEFDDKIKAFCKNIDGLYDDISDLENEKERLGIDDLDVEVVEAEVSDEDFDLSIDDDILKEL